MTELILGKYGELVLKGLNRPTFEAILLKNIRRRLTGCGNFDLKTAQSTVYVTPRDENADLPAAFDRLKRVFGLSSLSMCAVCEKDIEKIKQTAAEYLERELKEAGTFKVEAKRSDKRFGLNSPQICAEVGADILEKYPHLRVNVHEPDLTVTVEVRDFAAYVHGAKIPGAGGMPVGTNGRAALLVSGGIDSPVAGYMIAKRGVALTAVHFHSFPYTSERAKQKVADLIKIVSRYSGRTPLLVVPFTEIQTEIHKHCPDDLFTLIMRRAMMQIAEIIAVREGCQALITGESIGQVASQTIQSLAVTNASVSLPVFRPLIGMDKEEIIHVARKIDTLETSLLPYEDCCTIFTPKHPKTKPVLSDVEEAEAVLNLKPMIEKAAAAAELII
jgi:thiamine biosynthesis protein ThiI